MASAFWYMADLKGKTKDRHEGMDVRIIEHGFI